MVVQVALRRIVDVSTEPDTVYKSQLRSRGCSSESVSAEMLVEG
jgi:hypothetical protein